MTGRPRRRWLRRIGTAAAALAVLTAGAFFLRDFRLERAFQRALAEGTAAASASASATSVRVVSYNVWALPVWLPGSRSQSRLPFVPAAVAELGADVIVLQEAFDLDFRAFVVEALGAWQTGPRALCQEPMLRWSRKDCTGGLLTLSLFPVEEEVFRAHPLSADPKLDEKIGQKGVMLTTVQSPMGPLDVVNVHLYAGRTEADEAERMTQVRALRDLLVEAGSFARPVLLAGDLNVVHPQLRGTGARSTVYDFFIDSLGFTDTRSQVGPSDFTYDAEHNRYAGLSYNAWEGRQVFDYVLVRVPDGFAARVVSQGRVLDGEEPLSDHYGFYVEVDISTVDSLRTTGSRGS